METVARKSGNFRHPDTERPSFSVEPGGLEGCHTAVYFAGLDAKISAEKKGVATALNPTSLLQSPVMHHFFGGGGTGGTLGMWDGC